MHRTDARPHSSRLSRVTVASVLVLAVSALGAAPTQSCGGPQTGVGGTSGLGGTGGSPTARCGNGKIEAGEQCDGADLGGESCATHSPHWPAGTLTCSPLCLLNEWDCKASTCGDGIANLNEECDGDDLMGLACETIAASRRITGKLECLPNCRLNRAACTAVPGTRCGNGIIEEGERCDGPMHCAEYSRNYLAPLGEPADRYTDGMVHCEPMCDRGIATACSSRRCGNGVVEPSYGEDCDGSDLGGKSCADYLPYFSSGQLRCNSKCETDRSDCHGCSFGRTGLACR
jgi:hypothetical protein